MDGDLRRNKTGSVLGRWCSRFRIRAQIHDRLGESVPLTSDGLKVYLKAVEDAFGWGFDYAMLLKHYRSSPETPTGRYSPSDCTGCTKEIIKDGPEAGRIPTWYVERQNLTIRMKMRSFTRLTNRVFKKLASHEHAIGLHLMV